MKMPYHPYAIGWLDTPVPGRNKITTETLPLRAISYSQIFFTKSMQLKSTDVTILKNICAVEIVTFWFLVLLYDLKYCFC